MRSGTGGPADLFYEDLTVGREFDLGEVVVDEAEMRAFATAFDPQWYHVDDELAAESTFGGVIASGWFTSALFMRLYVAAVLSRAAADASPGVEELRWNAPVRAGDRLRGSLRVLAQAPSRSRPGLGTVTLSGALRCEQRGVVVLRMRFRGWFRRRRG
ncbi:acyl dehydratase [Stackebrandtia albiflava]|uniref:Acyl dehydratase n=1 Tax=Stackebrandtia albiflava TaxID=406432 RepID=A0A562V4E8_9ACTN|nr:MaoC/PaaZ C-terminal domain-containing protein [Stackebrandtia albiflava]TWJ12753.1 acyl dehydratase [Stackebrandtia albiflava]